MDRIWKRNANLSQQLAALDAKLERLRLNTDLSQQLTALDAKLERMWLDLDFVRTRLSSYLGDGVALTYLVDATPIYINSNDCGSPSNLLNGGRYEEENLEVLLSFVKEDTIFLDIGANLGFFTLQIGKRIVRKGRVYSFEPHPKLSNLLRWNVHLNGLAVSVTCFPFGLSDQNSPAKFAYPIGHLGGGAVGDLSNSAAYDIVDCELRRLDDVLGPEFSCDLVKIDVEGHELNVLKGMKQIVKNSPEIKILFEKISLNVGTEEAFEEYFNELGCDLYHVRDDSSLEKLVTGSLKDRSGYVLAARDHAIEENAKRSRFSVYPGQLLFPAPYIAAPVDLRSVAKPGDILFHGPYWFLRKGVWRFKLHGAVKGAICFILQERFGYHVLDFLIREGQSEHIFTLKRDLIYFECVARSATESAEIELDRLEFVREA
jgi:FkbM family methyltransferase